MGYEEVTGEIANIITDEGGESIEGRYTGSYLHHGEFGGDPTETMIYTLDNDGDVVSFYSRKQLDYKMKTVPIGTWVRITHTGMEHVAKLKKKVHQFKVEIDASRSKVADTPNTTDEPADEEMPY